MSTTQYGRLPVHAPAKVYLIGDVHNEADKLINLLAQIEPLLTPEDHIVFTGDLFDRGTQPTETLVALIDLVHRHPDQVFFVEGNHDTMLKHYLATGSTMWMQYLGSTLEGWKTSWNLGSIRPEVIAAELLNRGFTAITSRTAPYYESDKLIATHAPIDPTVFAVNGGKHYQQDYADRANNPSFTYMLDRMNFEIKWQFTEEHFRIPEIDKFRVCGHQFGRGGHPRIFIDRAFIDSGCGKGKFPVTCLVYPGKKYFQGK